MALDWLKKLRLENFPNQTALALAAGIKPARYSRIENGYCDLREEDVEGLAKALKLMVEEVRNGQLVPTTPQTVKSGPPPNNLAAQAIAPQPTPALSAPVVAKPPQATVPSDNLTDPKNFTRLPPSELLSIQNFHDAAARARLQQAIAFAEKVLHTSKVPAAVWREWRDFSRAAQNLLRGPAMVSAPNEPKPVVTPQVPTSMPLPKRTVAVEASPTSSSTRLRGNKNIFGHFVDVAKDWLPAAQFADLSQKAAAAKTQNPELGFMKHFRKIAEAELSRAEFNRIDGEASRRGGVVHTQ